LAAPGIHRFLHLSGMFSDPSSKTSGALSFPFCSSLAMAGEQLRSTSEALSPYASRSMLTTSSDMLPQAADACATVPRRTGQGAFQARHVPHVGACSQRLRTARHEAAPLPSLDLYSHTIQLAVHCDDWMLPSQPNGTSMVVYVGPMSMLLLISASPAPQRATEGLVSSACTSRCAGDLNQGAILWVRAASIICGSTKVPTLGVHRGPWAGSASATALTGT
jgi:hypothetical protein